MLEGFAFGLRFAELFEGGRGAAGEAAFIEAVTVKQVNLFGEREVLGGLAAMTAAEVSMFVGS